MEVDLLGNLGSSDCVILSLLFLLDCVGSVSSEVCQLPLLPLELAAFCFISVDLTCLLVPFV